jgi:hypothetical protein
LSRGPIGGRCAEVAYFHGHGCDTRLDDVIPQLIGAFLLDCNRCNCDLFQGTTPDTLRHADEPQRKRKYCTTALPRVVAIAAGTAR